MNRREAEWQSREYTEHVRESFYDLNGVLDMLEKLAESRPDDVDLQGAVGELRRISHELFNRVTVMKMWDELSNDYGN